MKAKWLYTCAACFECDEVLRDQPASEQETWRCDFCGSEDVASDPLTGHVCPYCDEVYYEWHVPCRQMRFAQLEKVERCQDCGAVIDKAVCYCGETIKGHSTFAGHYLVPMGCECHRGVTQ